MQLTARDGTKAIFADEALKQKSYLCPQCEGELRLKRGFHRIAHFYHTASHVHCAQHRKGLEHILTQQKIFSALPPGQAFLERPFTEISRIADVCWEKEKIIFEIQCSPISQEEVEGRCADYRSLGYEIVWILHTQTFNRRRISAAESQLLTTPCYFTNINAQGAGMLFDQFSVCVNNLRLFKGPMLCIQIHLPKKIPPCACTDGLVRELLSRLSHWRIYFTGDLLDRFFENPWPLNQTETRLLEKHAKKPWGVKRFYMSLLNFLLEKMAK